jgi:hypothetical protein
MGIFKVHVLATTAIFLLQTLCFLGKYLRRAVTLSVLERKNFSTVVSVPVKKKLTFIGIGSKYRYPYQIPVLIMNSFQLKTGKIKILMSVFGPVLIKLTFRYDKSKLPFSLEGRITYEPLLILTCTLTGIFYCFFAGSIKKKFLLFFILIVTGMDVDGASRPPVPGEGAKAAAAAAAAFQDATAARQHNSTTGSCNSNNTNQVTDSSDSPGSLFIQCSNAKRVSRTSELLECCPTPTGPNYSSIPATVPRIGSMYLEGQDDLQKNFHGARIMKGGKQSNEVITSSFDPATLNCLACTSPHRVLDKLKPVTICFSDQNFIPTLRSDTGAGCIAIVRYEDAHLTDLASIAIEILDNYSLHPGSVLLFGSASHLFRVGVSCYAVDWINLLLKLEQRFKNTNICPLIPVIRENCPGALARDIELLATWLNRVYLNNIKGLVESWNAVVHFVQNAATGQTTFLNEDVIKVPLPANLTSDKLQPCYFRVRSSNPVLLTGMDCTVSAELVRILLAALRRDFSIAVDPEVILPRVTTALGEKNNPQNKHLVCIGSSIMKQLIPFLQAAGYTISDLAQPGWLATDDNIQQLIKKMSDLQIEQGFSVVLDLVSNCSHRYLQFDGTQSLPHKEGGKYHMAGPVVPCNEDIFKRILKSLSPVLLAAQLVKKVLIPPLPRYLFNTCCSSASHCTNFRDENYAESALNGLTKLRGVLKKECGNMGMRNQWVLDGVGALAGIPPGESSGTNREMLSELKSNLAPDGVHLTQAGNKNLAAAIIKSLTLCGVKENSVCASISVPGGGSGPQRRPREYYWRGFTSPVGDTIGRVTHSQGSSTGGDSFLSRRERGRLRGRPYWRRN